MKFEEALKAMREGKAAKRKHWISTARISQETFFDNYSESLNWEDLNEDDWEIVNDQP